MTDQNFPPPDSDSEAKAKAFLAEMERHRKEQQPPEDPLAKYAEAEHQHPSVLLPQGERGLTGMLIGAGLVQTKEQASLVMLVGGGAVVLFIAWLVLF